MRRSVAYRLFAGTVAASFRYRVTGLAAEAAFFALVSLPPLLLGLVATLGYVTDRLGSEVLGRIEQVVVDFASQILSERTVAQVVTPILREVLTGGRVEVLSASFLLALWSGSRALNVYVDTISIAYGLGGRRGIVRTRVLSFTLYLLGLLLGVVAIPLVLAGPSFLQRTFPGLAGVIGALYWPVSALLSVAFLATLYHAAVPVRTTWLRAVPGALLAFVIWVLGSFLLRGYLIATVTGVSIYGPLAAPVAILFWLYVTALAVLVGATLNAEVDRMWPAEATTRARAEEEAAEAAAAAQQGEEDGPARPAPRPL